MSLFSRFFEKKKEPPGPSADEQAEQAELAAIDAIRRAAEKDDWERAAKACEEVLAKLPNLRSVQDIQFDILMRSKNYDEALEALERAYGNRPKGLNYYVNRSWIATERREFESAIEFADKALELDQRQAMALNNRGYALLCLCRFDEAIRDLNRALGINSGLDIARRNLIAALGQIEDFEKAEYEAHRLATKGADRFLGYGVLKHVYLMQNKRGLALQAVRNSLEIKSRDVSTALDQVFLCGVMGLHTECKDAVRHLRSLQPEPFYLDLADAALRDSAGDWLSASALWSKMDPPTSRIETVAHSKALHAAANGRLEEALKLLGEATGNWKRSEPWDHLAFRCSLLMELRQDSTAGQLLDDLLQRWPSYPLPVRLRARLAIQQGNLDEARALMKRLEGSRIARDHDHYIQYALEFHAAQFDAALEVLGKSTGYLPPSENSLYRAAVHVHREDWDLARTDLETALQVGTRALQAGRRAAMGDHWQWLAGCHALTAQLPHGDKEAELAKAMEFYRLSMRAGYYSHRSAWFQPWLFPLRGVEEFRQLCGQ
ncbi:MAG: tetratricopeptide repeat protein [Planctomycetes bacterium]|nr:tetratricopeptide repeat protein [Planctomycetota bacterium]